MGSNGITTLIKMIRDEVFSSRISSNRSWSDVCQGWGGDGGASGIGGSHGVTQPTRAGSVT